jgi:hypothetical protein
LKLAVSWLMCFISSRKSHTKKKVIVGPDVPILMLHESFYSGSWEKTGSSLLLPSHVSIVLRLRCGIEFLVFGTSEEVKSSRTCSIGMDWCFCRWFMMLQKAIAADTVLRIISSCFILFAAARVMHVVWLASCLLSRAPQIWYRSAGYISAACMRFARLYIYCIAYMWHSHVHEV